MWIGFRMRVIAQGGLEAFQREVSDTAVSRAAANRKNEAKMFETEKIEEEKIDSDGLDRMTLGEVLYFALFGEGMQAA